MNSPAGIGAPASARSGARIFTISAGCTVPRRRAETIRWAPSSSGRSGRLGGSPTSITTPWPAGLKNRSTRSRSPPSSGTRARSSTISMPSPAVRRANRVMTGRASSGSKSMAGHA